MDVIKAQPSKIKAQIRLRMAIEKFEKSLSAENRALLDNYKNSAHKKEPDLNDVRRIIADIDRRAGRPCGGRFRKVLEALQQFAALGDLAVGATQNTLAAGAWSVARLTFTVSIDPPYQMRFLELKSSRLLQATPNIEMSCRRSSWSLAEQLPDMLNLRPYTLAQTTCKRP